MTSSAAELLRPLPPATVEILVIALIILLIWGGKKIPELMHGLGKGVKSFKDGMNEVTNLEEEKKEEPKQKDE